MPRSPTDATRFTPTSPHVSAKPSSSSSPNFSYQPNAAPPYGGAAAAPGTQLNFQTGAPANETPQQKIARLRAAAQLAKRGKETSWDKTVRIGRIWADRAHRATAIGLIGFTVLSTAVAAAGITDMLLHNRRRRNEWLAEKQAESARELAIAKQAYTQGAATEDQILLINRERAADEAEWAKRNRPGVFKRTTNWLFSGPSKEEQKGGTFGVEASAQIEATFDQAQKAASSFVEEGKSALRTVEDKVDVHRRTGEMVEELVRPSGGPLDREAQRTVEVASSTARSWTNWLTGR